VLLGTVIASVLCVGGCLGAPTIEARALDLHNRERAAVGSPPIEWDAHLAADAAEWTGEPDNGQGENLFLGTRGAFDLDAMIGFWSVEKTDLKRLANWEDDFHTVGHYTQMVWNTTTHVGCAVASNADDDYLVCRYSPAGNVEGEQPFPRAVTIAAVVR
jgi:hypothetical protein